MKFTQSLQTDWAAPIYECVHVYHSKTKGSVPSVSFDCTGKVQQRLE